MGSREAQVGRYRVVRRLAIGGMGEVFLAENPDERQRPVVVKTLREPDDGAQRLMFLDEARIASSLVHDHLAQVYEVGRHAGGYFLAMEYVHGESVRTVLERASARRRPLPLDFCLTVIAAAAAGLHHAHQRRGPDGAPLGIVHRDVTPSNLMVGFDGAVKVIDFGIAKAARRATSTQGGAVKGKTAYLAPEQLLAQPVDRRADVFALGVVLYELCTLTRAFVGANEYETMQRVVKVDLVPPSLRVSGFPLALEAVIARALARAPADRYPDTLALRRALLAVADTQRLELGPAAVRRCLASLFEPVVAAVADETSSGRRRRLARGTGAAGLTPELPDDFDPARTTLRWEWLPPAALLAGGASGPSVAPPAAAPAVAAPAVATSVAAPATLASPPVAVASAVIARAPARRRGALLVGAAALALVAAIAIVAWPRPPLPASPRVAPAGPAPSAPPIAPAVVAPAPAAVAPTPTPTPAPAPARTVWLRVTSAPTDATVLLDGVRLGRTPLAIEVERRGRTTATLKLRRHGRAVRIAVPLVADVVEHVVIPGAR
jgi:hypothetical protein